MAPLKIEAHGNDHRDGLLDGQAPALGTASFEQGAERR
jgi:hypothetical protein